MPLEDTLELDISSALQSIDTLASSMDQAATQFGVALAEAIDTLREPVPVEADVSSIAPDIEAAVAGAEVLVIPEADASAITPAIDEAVAAADVLVVPEADASAITDEISAAIDAADSTVVVGVEAEVGDIAAEIEAAIDGADTTIVIEADTGQATDAIADLGGAASGASGGVGDLTTGLGGLDVISAAAVGDVTNLTGGIGKFAAGHPVMAGAVAGIGALVATTGVFVDAALGARESADTFAIAVGDMGDEVRNIDVGGLNQDLGDLAVSLGQDDEAAFNAASRIFQLGEAAGVARPKVADTTKEILALGAQAIAVNPSLGDLGSVAEGLVGALARGGRPAANFGIALTAAEINARALKDTGKETAAELSIFEKSAAGAAIATERLGDSIGERVQSRVETAATGFARLRQEFDNVLESAGQPLLDPLLASLDEAQPAIEATATATGEMLAQVVPLAAEVAGGLVPAVEAAAESLGLLADTLGLVIAAGDGMLSWLPEGTDSLAEFGGAATRALNPFTPLIDGAEALKGPWEDLFGGGGGAEKSLIGSGTRQIEASTEALAAAGEASGEWTRTQALLAIEHTKNADGTRNYADALTVLESGFFDSEGAAEKLGDAAGTTDELLGTMGETAAAAAEEMTALRTAMDVLLGAFVGAEAAGLAYLRAQDGVESSAVAVFEAQVALNTAIRDHGDGSKEAAAAAEELSDAQLGLKEANLGAFTSATDLTVAMEKQTGALKGAGPEAAALRDELVAMRDRFPELRDEIDKHIAKIDAMAVPDLKMDEAVIAAKTAISGLAASLGPITDAQAKEVGRVFGRGLANGLNSESEKLRLAGVLAGEKVTQGARWSFGQRSPSKVGLEIGSNFAKAIAAGIEDDAPFAADAAAALAEDVVAKINNALFADFVAGGAFEGRRLAISLPGVVETEEAETLFRVLRSGNPTIAEWVALLDGTGLSMEQLLGIQKDLNAEVQTFASQMVSAFDTVEDALAGLKPDTSLLDFMEDANERVRATLELERDLNTLRRRGADDLAAALASQGANAAQAVADAIALSPEALRAQEREFERILAIDERNAERAQSLATALVATVDSPEVTEAAVKASAKLGERTADGLAYGIASRSDVVRDALTGVFRTSFEGALAEALDRMAQMG